MKNLSLVLLYLMLYSFRCDAQSGWTNYNTKNSPLLDDRVSSIAIDHNNNLWGAYAGAGGSGNGIVKFDGNTWTPYNTSNSGLPNNDIRDIAIDPQGNIWFACYNAGIVKYDGVTWTRYYAANSNIAGNDAVDIEFDSNGNMWIGCYFSGVSKFDGSTWITYTKNNAPFADSNCISDLTIDKFNNVWVGMDCQGGMAKFSSTSQSWTGYKTSNSSIPDHTVTSLLADASGLIWASHINVNVSSFNGSTWTKYNEPKAIDKFALDDQGDLLGCGYGLFKFENGAWIKILIPEAADTTYAFGVAAGTRDNVWLSTYSGLWINKSNTPPVFEVAPIIVNEGFETFKVQIKPTPVPVSEQWQTVAYTLVNLNGEKITAAIDPLTGEITLASVAGMTGEASFKIMANDGQVVNNKYEVLVTVTIKAKQQITFQEIPQKTYGDQAFALVATNSSGLPLVFTSNNESIASIAGNLVTIHGAGEVIITASAAGNNNFQSAQVERMLIVKKADQVITFNAVENRLMGSAAFNIAATTTSALAVQLSSTSNHISVTGSTITLLSPGSVTIKANQVGNVNYNAAALVQRTFCINPTKPIITPSDAVLETVLLTSSQSIGNQWYRNGELILNETSASISVSKDGSYTVVTSVEGCSGEPSEPYVMVITGLDDERGKNSVLYPNPGTDKVKLDLSSFTQTSAIEIQIFDIHGRKIQQLTVSGQSEVELDIHSLNKGAYILKASNNGSLVIARFIKL
jgi:hypothetical protein